MDDFIISNLNESRNEWCCRLISILTPLVIEGIHSIFNESWKLCLENEELNKYLMTFQNLLSRVPKWNSVIVEEERKRIIQRSGCNYLEDLISCVHIIQLKILTCIRVGNKQKQIDITIPKLDNFLHKVYINAARKLYTNVFLFEKNITPLHQQKNNREIEQIIQECIMIAIRESIPTEQIIRAYMDEAIEEEEEVIIEPEVPAQVVTETEKVVDEPVIDMNNENITFEPVTESHEQIDVTGPSVNSKLTFNDIDSILNQETNQVEEVDAPKTIERLEHISAAKAMQRKLDEEDDDEDYRIKIDTNAGDVKLDEILSFDMPDDMKRDADIFVLNDVEELF